MITIDISGDADLRALIRDLREQARGALPRKLRRNIRRATDPVVRDIRAAVMRVDVQALPPARTPGRRRKRTNLRARVASAVTVTATQEDVRIGVVGSRVGPYGTVLAGYLDAELARYQIWRHPVFGHPVWVIQRGEPWFFKTIEGRQDTFYRAVLDALDETHRELSR